MLVSASQVLLPLATYPYITRVLGPGNLGKVNYVDFAAQVFIILSALGIPLYATRETAMLRNNAPKKAQLVKELAVVHIAISVLCAAIFLLLMWYRPQQDKILYLLGAANILVASFSFDWYIRGMEYFKFAAVRDIIIKTGMLLCFFLLVKSSNDYVLYFGIFTAAMLLNAILNAARIISENKFDNGALNLRQHFTPLFHLFLTSSAIGIYEYFDTIILEYITKNEQQVGYYTTILKMIRLATTMLITAGTVVLPRISFLLSSGNKDGAKKYLDKFLNFIITAGVPACTGLFIFAPEIIQVIAGDKFMPAVPLMQLLGFLPLIIGISNVFCYQVLVAFKQERKFLITALAGCIISISLNFLLVPYWAAKGAALAALGTELTVAVAGGIMASKFIRIETGKAGILQTIILAVLFFPMAVLCRHIFPSPLAVLTAGIPLCAGVYGSVQYFVFKNSVAKETVAYIKNIFSSKG